ncbi:inositol-pentakisphosphate 2-kinase-like [Rutidosis leptorrhynchoides]|uniref:inositol-pentakisphosphate 2-kinase-like n=1 Tax=Rutidosis leptorrhynchoides TaxID=125765 RepID=UPI003A98FDFA
MPSSSSSNSHNNQTSKQVVTDQMVELILEAKDAADWIYRGEGGLNIVLAYNGSSPNFYGKVLRVRKHKKNASEYEKAPSALCKHECLVWKDVEELLSAPTKDIANHMYAQLVMCPLLGSQYVDAGVRVMVTKEFLESLHNCVLLKRPSWRVETGRVDTSRDSAILMSDHSVFPNVKAVNEEEFCISVEIKPKCGFLPISRFIREENLAKKRISRFKLHQILKFHQGKISQISEYDPVDMFSRSKTRVLKSVKDLFLTPQNNFRVFLNGSLILGSLGGEANDTNTQIAQAFEDTLKDIIEADEGLRTHNFLQLVAEAVSDSGIMDRLVKVQKLDILDIEGAIHAYYDVVNEPCVVCKELEGKVLSRYESLHSIPFEQSLKIVRDFFISSTAKDLSLMISFRSRGEGNKVSPYGGVFLESINQSFDYKASFIDLDMKPLEKMPYYYKLDQEIISCYARMMETLNQPTKSLSETPFQDRSRAREENSHC